MHPFQLREGRGPGRVQIFTHRLQSEPRMRRGCPYRFARIFREVFDADNPITGFTNSAFADIPPARELLGDRIVQLDHTVCELREGINFSGTVRRRAAINFEAAMIRLAPMATRIAIGFWSIAQRVTAMNYTRPSACLARILFCARISSREPLRPFCAPRKAQWQSLVSGFSPGRLYPPFQNATSRVSSCASRSLLIFPRPFHISASSPPWLSRQLPSNVTATRPRRRCVTTCTLPSKSMYVRRRSLTGQRLLQRRDQKTKRGDQHDACRDPPHHAQIAWQNELANDRRFFRDEHQQEHQRNSHNTVDHSR